jgi:hypothetical protein
VELYPDIHFQFNRKSVIKSELDIYIPSLKLAFELNGIYHYLPIHGNEKLASIQKNDALKAQACQKQHIEFYSIDTSKQKSFKELSSKSFLLTIVDVINKKLGK